jgi:SAM-dependent methyltransferase
MKCFYCHAHVLVKTHYITNSKVFYLKKIYICKKCKILFSKISQKELDNFYKADYYKNSQQESIKHYRSKIHIKKAIDNFKIITPQKKINILDYGAGLGHTLELCKKIYPNSTLFAYENSKSVFKHLRKVKIKVFSGSPLKKFKESPKIFDIIFASHFIEHLSPKILTRYLGKIYRQMNNNSILIAEVPNEYKTNLKFQITPHTLFFSKYSIKKIFRSYFKLIELYNYSVIPKNFYERLKIKVCKIFGVWDGNISSKGEMILIVAKKSNLH